MSYLDANHREQMESATCREQRTADFLAAHPEYRNPVPPSQWPALLDGLPGQIAQAFTPLIATSSPKEGNAHGLED